MSVATYRLDNEQSRQYAIDAILNTDLTSGKQVAITEVQRKKTREQLGALFGVWVKYIEEQTGYTKDEIHKHLKNLFLRRVYADDYESYSATDPRKLWLDTIVYLAEKQDWAGVAKVSSMGELKHATCAQVRRYMDEIQNYYISHDMPLPVPDSFRKVYR
jgi:hypothetical protein